MIRLINISKTFNTDKPNAFTALKAIDHTIQPHRITVFRGSSGSGKTTLLSIIGCMSRPTSGRIYLEDREISSLPERFTAAIRRHTFGFIFQSYNLISGITVLENIMLPAFPDGPNYQQLKRRAMELLEKFHLSSKFNQKVEHLSGGEQQRAAIARALINDPPYIIADEPTAHLDSDLAAVFMAITATLKHEGKTLLIASHDPLVFQAPAVDTVVTMKDGQIESVREGA